MYCQDCRWATKDDLMVKDRPLLLLCTWGLGDYDDRDEELKEDEAYIIEEPCAGHTGLYVGPKFGCVHFAAKEGGNSDGRER